MKFHYHLLINQAAGSGNGQKAGEKIINIMKDKRFSYEAYFTEYAGHELKIAETLANDVLVPWQENTAEAYEDQPFPLLLVIGGDGTLHQVLNQFYQMGKEFPVGYIPGGSGNDFARGIGLPREPEQAFWALYKAQQPKNINILTYHELINGERGLVVNNVGIGLDAAIVNATNDSKTKSTLNKYNMGSLAYMTSIVKVLFTQKGFPTIVEINGAQHNFCKTFLCTTTNHPYFGGGVKIAPMADPYKENLDLVLVERMALWKIFVLIFQLIRQKHTKSKNFHHFSGSKLRIVSTVPEYGQADGEVMGQRPFDIRFATKKQPIWF